MGATDGRIVHVGPGEGKGVRMSGEERMTRKVAAEQTGGAYSLSEVTVLPGAGPQPHVQHREDECFYVPEGGFEFLTEGSGVEAGPGSLIYGAVYTSWRGVAGPERDSLSLGADFES